MEFGDLVGGLAASSEARRSASRARSRSRAITTLCRPSTAAAAGNHEPDERRRANGDAVPAHEAAGAVAPGRRLGLHRFAGDDPPDVVGELLHRVVAAVGSRSIALRTTVSRFARRGGGAGVAASAGAVRERLRVTGARAAASASA